MGRAITGTETRSGRCVKSIPALLTYTIVLGATALGAQESLAFRNVNVVPMDSARVMHNQTVVVSKGVVVALGSTDSVEVPAGSLVVDGTGRFLMPGLMDTHVHVEQPYELALYVVNGVTTVLNTKGRSWHLELRDAPHDPTRAAPRLLTCGPYVRDIDDPSAAVIAVRETHELGFDCVKIKGDWSQSAYEALVTEARRVGIPLIGHAPRNQPLDLVLDEAYQAVAHLEELVYTTRLDELIDEARGIEDLPQDVSLPAWATSVADSLARAVAASGVWITPTQIVFDVYRRHTAGESIPLDEPFAAYVDAAAKQRWDEAIPPSGALRYATQTTLQRYLLGALLRAGANLALGTDSELAGSNLMTIPGWAVHRELALYVGAGLEPFDALATATRDAGRFLGKAESDGVIREGARADLVLVRKNPLESIEHARLIDGVVLGGTWRPRSQLDDLLNEIEERHRGGRPFDS